MSDTTNPKKTCFTCNKSTGILICAGCENIFCGKHITEHRQDLAVKLDCIMQEHDLIRHKIEQISIDQSLLKKINQWEKKNLEKIKLAADTARKNLEIILNQSKEQLSKTSHDIAADLCASYEADDYSEINFIHWNEQLEKLQEEVTSSSLAQLTEDKSSIIPLIKVERNNGNNKKVKETKPLPPSPPPPLPTPTTSTIPMQDVFTEVLGSVKLESGGYLVRYVGSKSGHGYIRGKLKYTEGVHTIRFKLEKFTNPYCIFFGCMSSQVVLKKDAFRLPHSIGWSGYCQVYQHGRCDSDYKKHGYKATVMAPGHIVRLTFDCNTKQIALLNENAGLKSKLSVDVNKAPFPWQLLVVMFNTNDCVRILDST